MTGWIKLHRKILDNPVVFKDADHIAVWTYLLLNATHKEYSVMFAGQKTMLQPGQVITGRKSISEKLRVQESKVERILKLFESEQQIEQQKSNKNRIVTLVSWHEYQGFEQQNDHEMNNKRTTNEQQVNTNKNYKNENNDKEGKRKRTSRQREAFAEDSSPYRMAVYMLKRINSWTDKMKQPDLQKWAEDCRKIIDIDKRDMDLIRNVIDWATNHHFWKSNILSPTALRNKFDTLVLQMDSKNPREGGDSYERDARARGGSAENAQSDLDGFVRR